MIVLLPFDFDRPEAQPHALREGAFGAARHTIPRKRTSSKNWGTKMKQLIKLAAAAAIGAVASGTIVYAQAATTEPPKARVALYRAAPGQQVALLKWLAGQNRAAQAAGLPAGQLYVHTDGDSWDYLAIDPITTAAQDAAVDAAAKKMGMATGPAASLEFRKYISLHTDTFVIGPVTPERYLAMAGQ